MTVQQATRRFLILRGLRWLPTGLVIPVLVLLLQQRGLSLGQIGLVAAAQGVMIMVLELPTGGLADSLGRRPVLVVAEVFALASMGLLAVADSLWLFGLVFALAGVYRALDSGPLDAWYVDTAQTADPDADIEAGLARGGVVLGLAIALGSVLSSALVATHPITVVSALTVPILIAMVFHASSLAMVLRLMDEGPRPDGTRQRRGVRAMPTVISSALRVIRTSTILTVLVTDLMRTQWGRHGRV